MSFYENAWPILKKKKIPFILFVSTEPVGKSGYMNWDQIKDVSSYDFAYIGNHSHTHEYLLNFSHIEFEKDIKNSIKIFKNNLGYNPIFFSIHLVNIIFNKPNLLKIILNMVLVNIQE